MLVEIYGDEVDKVVLAGLKEQYSYLVKDMEVRAMGITVRSPIFSNDPVADVEQMNELRLAMRKCIRYYSTREEWKKWKKKNPRRIQLEWSNG